MTSTRVGEMLRRLRIEKGVSLRVVEKETGVSNAYLSQLESGKAEQPSPHILHKLAGYYGVHYSRLMEAAGHLKPDGDTNTGPSAIQAALMEEGLDQREQQMIVKFIEFLRKEKATSGGSSG